ncbi:MAG TPA: PH domain-containing protein [Actinomycetota bacterium]
MAFPRRLLAPGEDIVLDLRPHWISVFVSGLEAVAALVVYVILLLNVPDSWAPWVRWLLFIVLALILILTLGRKLIGWATSHFVVTTERVIHRSGWLAKQSMEIPVDRISDVKFGQSIFERLVGAGNLTIESAGEFGQQKFDYIMHPERVQKTIYEQSRRARDSGQSPPAQAPPSPAPPSTPAPSSTPTITRVQPPSGMIADELAKLDELRKQGVLSEEEFQRQKARLLDQR